MAAVRDGLVPEGLYPIRIVSAEYRKARTKEARYPGYFLLVCEIIGYSDYAGFRLHYLYVPRFNTGEYNQWVQLLNLPTNPDSLDYCVGWEFMSRIKQRQSHNYQWYNNIQLQRRCD